MKFVLGLFLLVVLASPLFAQSNAATTPTGSTRKSTYLIRLQLTRPEAAVKSTPEEDRIVSEHFAYLKRYTEQGTLVFAGRTTEADRTFGIVVLEVASEDEARKIMENDPAIKGGVMRGELFPFHIALQRKQ